MICYLMTVVLAIGAPAMKQQAPEWEASYGKALEATRTEKAPLLVVLDKPESKEARIAPKLLNGESANGEKSELLSPYRLCHVDVTTGYGKKVAKAFNAKEFPHVAIIDKTGSTVIFHKTGKIESKEWKQILLRHKSGDRSLASTVSRLTYKPVGDSPAARPYCPNCQRNSF